MTADYRAAIETAALFDRSDRGKVVALGPEAPQFLHNLSTNDVLNLPLGGGCELFFCTARGRVVEYANVFHLRLGGGPALWIDGTPGRHAELLAHLERHLIAEQVELHDRTADFAQWHVAGPSAGLLLEIILDEPVPDLSPLQHMERTFGKVTASVRRLDPFGVPGYDLVCLRNRSEELRSILESAGAVPATAATAEILRVEAATPLFGRDIDTDRFAPEVGRGGAICFTKGCYLGQEPIVMARDRAGFVNRALYGLTIAGDTAASVGTPVLRGDLEVGTVTSAAVSPRFGPIALAYLKRGQDDPDAELTVAGRPVTIRVRPAPFAG